MEDLATATQIALHLIETGLLIDIERARYAAVDKWQMAWVSGGAEPPSQPPDGYEALGAWEPYAATENSDGWKRPLGRVGVPRG